MDPNMFANFYFLIIFFKRSFYFKKFFYCSPNFYQVKSFLAVQTSYSPNGVLLKPCDDFLIIRNLKAESDWRKNYNDNKQVGGMRK
jgi:hypothetical protein